MISVRKLLKRIVSVVLSTTLVLSNIPEVYAEPAGNISDAGTLSIAEDIDLYVADSEEQNTAEGDNEVSDVQALQTDDTGSEKSDTDMDDNVTYDSDNVPKDDASDDDIDDESTGIVFDDSESTVEGHGQSALGWFTVNNITYYYYADGTAHVHEFETGDYNYSTKKYEHYFNPVLIPATVTYGGKTYTVDGIQANASSDKSLVISGGLIMPKTIKLIGDYSFDRCSRLTGELHIPEGVTDIGAWAFGDCYGFIGDLNLPEGLLNIGLQAFQNCYKLNGTLTVPSTLKSIDSNAFWKCSGFTHIVNNSGLTFRLPTPFNNKVWINTATLKKADTAGANSEYIAVDNSALVYLPRATINNEGYAVASFVLTDVNGNVLKNREFTYNTSDGISGTDSSDGDGIVVLKSDLKTYNTENQAKNSGNVTYTIVVTGDNAIYKTYRVDYDVAPYTFDKTSTGTITVENGNKTNGTTGVSGIVSFKEPSGGTRQAEATFKLASKFDFPMGLSYLANENKNTALNNFKGNAKAGVEGAVSVGYNMPSINGRSDMTDDELLDIGRFLWSSAAPAFPDKNILLNQAMKSVNWNVGVFSGTPAYYSSKINVSSSSDLSGLKESLPGLFPKEFIPTPGASITWTTKDDMYKGERTNEISVSGKSETSLGEGEISKHFKFIEKGSYSLKTTSKGTGVNSISFSQNSSGSAGTDHNSIRRETNIKSSSINQIPDIRDFAKSTDFRNMGLSLESILSDIKGSKDQEGTYKDIKTVSYEGELKLNFKELLGLRKDQSIIYNIIQEYEVEEGAGAFNYDEKLQDYVFLPGSDNETHTEGLGGEFKKEIDIYNRAIGLAAVELARVVNVERIRNNEIGKYVGVTAVTVFGGFAMAASGGLAALVEAGWEVVVGYAAAAAPALAFSSYSIETCDKSDYALNFASPKRDVCQTVGRAVDIYIENADGNIIDDFSSTPMDIVLNYTSADLYEAGAALSDAAKLAIYTYSDEMGCYERLDSEVDEGAKSVRATIKKSGTYIIAINNIAPEIENLEVLDSSCTPRIMGRISSLGGLSDLSLKIDNVEVLNRYNYYEYFNAANDELDYTVVNHLDPGTHMLSITATDVSGNTMEQPYISYFDVTDNHASQARVESVSLSLEDAIAVNFYMSLPEGIADKGHVFANGRECNISEIQSNGTYKVTAKMSAKEIGDNILLEVKCAGMKPIQLVNQTSVAGKLQFSIRDYINSVSGNNDNLSRLANALDLYGCYAQKYFDYNVPASMPEIDKTVVKPSEMVTTGRRVSGIEYIGSSLVLKSRSSIRHYFNVTGDINSYRFTVDGKQIMPVESGGKYYIEIANISPAEYDRYFDTTVYDDMTHYTIRYSLYTYCYKALNKSSDEDLKNLIYSMYSYGDAAKNYFRGL